MSVTTKRTKPDKAEAAKAVKLQKEVSALRKENESLKVLIKQKDARLAVLSERFNSASICQNMVEAFDMENMFKQAAIDAQEHVQRLLKTILIKPEDFEDIKAELDRTKKELTVVRKEICHLKKQLKFKTNECEVLLEEKRSLTIKNQTLPNLEDFRTVEMNYRNRLIALQEEVRHKNAMIDQYANKLPSILSKDLTSEEYQRLEEELLEARKKNESLSVVLDELYATDMLMICMKKYDAQKLCFEKITGGNLKETILNLERERDDLRECVKNLEAETEKQKLRLDEYEQFERNLPPDAKTSVILQEELTAKDLALKRQHDDFVKQLTDMQGTVTYLRLQYDKHICVQNELERKKNEILQLKEEAKQASETIAEKEQLIKDLESHFDIRRSGLHHTVTALEKKLKSKQLELSENKRTIVKLMEENKKLSDRILNPGCISSVENMTTGNTLSDSTIETEVYKQQLLDEKQKLREEKRNHWKANERVKQLEIACQAALKNSK